MGEGGGARAEGRDGRGGEVAASARESRGTTRGGMHATRAHHVACMLPAAIIASCAFIPGTGMIIIKFKPGPFREMTAARLSRRGHFSSRVSHSPVCIMRRAVSPFRLVSRPVVVVVIVVSRSAFALVRNIMRNPRYARRSSSASKQVALPL